MTIARSCFRKEKSHQEPSDIPFDLIVDEFSRRHINLDEDIVDPFEPSFVPNILGSSGPKDEDINALVRRS